MTDRKPQEQDKFIVRLPDGMRDRIKAAAERNNRSMNAEIVATLEDAYPSELSAEEAVHYIRDLLSSLDPEDRAQAIAAALEAETRSFPRDDDGR